LSSEQKILQILNSRKKKLDRCQLLLHGDADISSYVARFEQTVSFVKIFAFKLALIMLSCDSNVFNAWCSHRIHPNALRWQSVSFVTRYVNVRETSAQVHFEVHSTEKQ
jgi:hypothetical protein